MLKFVAILVVLLTIVTRHDVDDALYIELGEKHGAVVAGISGGCGTLIRPTWVLTAAHVAYSSDLKGHVDIGGNRYAIKRRVLHPDFTLSAGVQHDIALVELSEPVVGVVPARLYTDSNEVGEEVIFVGTGWASSGDVGLMEGHINKDGHMRGAQNRVDGITGNYLRFTFDDPDSENALPLEGISGSGDSGGPALWFSEGHTYVMGVSSHQGGRVAGRPQGVYGVLEYYTRVSDYQDWMREVMGEG